MKVHLHDNAREAFQFLALGAGIVLVIRLIVAAFGLWSGDPSGDVLAEACAPFRNGYPLIGKHTLVVGGMELIPRVAVAGVFVLGCGLLLALLLIPVTMLLGWGTLRGAVLGGRTGLLLGATWAIYTLLCLPPRAVDVTNEGLVLHHRSAFLGQVPWPFGDSSLFLPWQDVEGFRHATYLSDGNEHELRVSVPDMDAALTRTLPERGDRIDISARRHAEAERLRKVLEEFRTRAL